MKRHQMVLIAAGIFFLAIPASAATWTQKAAGTYEWTAPANWLNGTLPSATEDAALNGSSYRPSGDQTITGDGTAKALDLHNSNLGTIRTFTGNIVASNLYLRVGKMNVEGNLTLTGTDQTYSIIGAAESTPNGILDILSGGTVRADGIHALCVGRRAATDNKPASGRIWLRDGGTLVLNPSGSTDSMSGLMLGRTDGSRSGTYTASYIQEGGQATLGRFMAGFETGAYGVMSIQGGVLDLPWISDETRFRVGHGGYGVFEQYAGDIHANTNKNLGSNTVIARIRYDNDSKYGFEVGSGCSDTDGLKGAYFYAQGGSFTTDGEFNIQGASYSKTGVNPAHATIASDAVVTARIVRVGANTGDGKASLNLIGGGTLVAGTVNSLPSRRGRSEINANGGKIVFPNSYAVQEQGCFLDAINIYEGGLEVWCDKDRPIYLGNTGTNAILRTPGGYGVAVSSVSTLTGSTCPPWINISGGSGSNAVAVALVDYKHNGASEAIASGTMTNAVMVCSGEGYDENDTLTATVVQPWASSSATDKISVSLVENKPGPLVKTGLGDLYLFSQPEFAGTYEVREGTLRQSPATGTASPKVRAVVVGGTDAEFDAGSANNSAKESNWNPINPAATLTLGTAYGPGTIAIPEGVDGKPFEQTFASLAVNGTGNVIKALSSSNNKYGVKLTFGTIACADGSQLTIPGPESNVKVYCTGMPAGTRLRNIILEGTDDYAAIADDGQLVKAPGGLVITFR